MLKMDFLVRASFRFHRCCLLWLTCRKEGTSHQKDQNNTSCFLLTIELEKRINNRIQSMLHRGLIDELTNFHTQYNQTSSESEPSYDYTRGIFQAIGFKEFHDYLLLSDTERKSEAGEKVFANGR